MNIVAAILPGGLGTTILGAVLCLLSFGFTLAVNPDYLVALFVVYAASLSGYLPALGILISEWREEYTSWSMRTDDRDNDSDDSSLLPGVLRIAKVQAVVATVQLLLWISAVNITIFNFLHELQDTRRLICPSKRCTLFSIASGLTYLHFVIVTVQFVLIVSIIARVRRAPRRIVGDKSFRVLMEQEIDTLLHVLEEARQNRASGTQTRPYDEDEEQRHGMPSILRIEGRDVGFVLNNIGSSSQALPEARNSLDDEAWPRRRRNSTAVSRSAPARQPISSRISRIEAESTVTSRRPSEHFPRPDIPARSDSHGLSHLLTRSDTTESDIIIYENFDQAHNPTFQISSPTDSYVSKIPAHEVPDSPHSSYQDDVSITRAITPSVGDSSRVQGWDVPGSPESRYSRVSYVPVDVENTPPHMTGSEAAEEVSPVLSDGEWVLRTPQQG